MKRAIIATLALAAASVSWAQPPQTACVYLEAPYRFDRTLNYWVENENRATNRWQGTLRLSAMDAVSGQGRGTFAAGHAGHVYSYFFTPKQSCPKVQTDGFMCAEKFRLRNRNEHGRLDRRAYFDFVLEDFLERGGQALCIEKLEENPDLWNDYDHYELTDWGVNRSETQLDCKYSVYYDDRWSWQRVGTARWHNMASYEFVGGPSPDGADGVLVYNGVTRPASGRVEDINIAVGRLSPRETCPSFGEPAHNGD